MVPKCALDSAYLKGFQAVSEEENFLHWEDAISTVTCLDDLLNNVEISNEVNYEIAEIECDDGYTTAGKFAAYWLSDTETYTAAIWVLREHAAQALFEIMKQLPGKAPVKIHEVPFAGDLPLWLGYSLSAYSKNVWIKIVLTCWLTGIPT